MCGSAVALSLVALCCAALSSACTLSFDRTKVLGDASGDDASIEDAAQSDVAPPDSTARDARDAEASRPTPRDAGEEAGDAAFRDRDAGLPGALALWTFAGDGPAHVVPERLGRISGAHLFAVPEPGGGARFVDGAAALDRVTFKTDPEAGTAMAEALVAAGAFSVELWTQVDPSTPGKPDLVTTSSQIFWIVEGLSQLDFGLLTPSAGALIAGTLVSEAPLRHVVAVFDNADPVARLYVQGDEVAINDARGRPPGAASFIAPSGETRLLVGSPQWRGRIYLAALYDRALRPSDVRALRDAGPRRGR